MPASPDLLPGEGGVRPKGNFLGLMTGDGEMIAIPPGATIVFVVGEEADDIQPKVLQKVERTKLQFRCACGKPNCTRVWKWSIAQATGHHPK